MVLIRPQDKKLWIMKGGMLAPGYHRVISKVHGGNIGLLAGPWSKIKTQGKDFVKGFANMAIGKLMELAPMLIDGAQSAITGKISKMNIGDFIKKSTQDVLGQARSGINSALGGSGAYKLNPRVMASLQKRKQKGGAIGYI